MAIVKYTGGAFDHEVVPETLKKRKDGKVRKRAIVVPAKTLKFPVEERSLWGMKFPKGEERKVEDAQMIKKMFGLGCFEILVHPEEPVTFDKAFMEKALQHKRFKKAKFAKAEEAAELPDAPEPEEIVPTVPDLSVDPYASMTRVELVRVAESRGHDVPRHLRKAEILDMLHADDIVAAEEVAKEGGFFDPDEARVELA